MKTALCQINTTIGDFENNIEKVCAFAARAKESGADIALFPELSVSSYPPLDLLDRHDFLAQNQDALTTLLECLKKEEKLSP